MFDQREQVNFLYKNLERFKEASLDIFGLLKEGGVVLNLAGYSDMITTLYFLDEGEFEAAFGACREILLWLDYLTVLRQRILNLLSSTKNKLNYLDAFVVYERINPQLDDMISKEQEKYSKIEKYLKVLDSQISLLRKHYKITLYRYRELCKEMMRLN